MYLDSSREWKLENTIDPYKKNYKTRQPTLTQIAMEGSEQVYENGATLCKKRRVKKKNNKKAKFDMAPRIVKQVKGQQQITNYFNLK